MDKEKIVNIAIVMFLAAIIIFVSIYLYSKYSQGQENVSFSIEFNNLCTQWYYDKCTIDALNFLDTEQEFDEKTTLTELCNDLYYYKDNVKTIQHCQDICNNKCSPKLSYDIAVYPGSIRFIPNSQTGDKIEITVYNLGSASVYYISILAEDEEGDIFGSWIIDIPSHETKVILIDSEEDYIKVKINLNYDDANTANNEAEKRTWL